MNLSGFEQKLFIPVREIVIQSPLRYRSTIKGFKEVAPFPEYTLKKAIVSEGSKYTNCANTCAILGMSNGKSTYLGHFAPEYHKSDFKNQLSYQVKKMQDETGSLTAIVTGGYDMNAGKNLAESKASYTQLAEIGEVLDKAHAELTMIAAKQNPSFVDNMAVTPNKFILSHSTKRMGEDAIPALRQCNNQAAIEDLLNQHYSIVEIEPNHTISFEG